MNGKVLVHRVLRGEGAPRVPWVPFVGVHGGKLAGVDAETYLQSADHMVHGLERAVALYRPDGLPITFDLQMEAEVLGCPLRWAPEVPPSVAGHPLEADPHAALPDFDTNAGRYPLIAEVMERLGPVAQTTAFYGLITGPFTLVTHLRGHQLFLDLIMQPEAIVEMLDRCADIACKAADFYLERGADVIAVVDPVTSQISPEHFDEFVTPAVDRVFDHIRNRGALSSLFICGNATRNIPSMCRTACDSIHVDENTALTDLAPAARAAGKAFGGNIHLTTVLLLGKPDDARLDTLRCLDEAGEAGYILAPGCDIPYGTPEENLEAVAELVHDPYKREVARTLVATNFDDGGEDDPDLPDFDAPGAVYVDVITLDSKACPPCQYMMSAAEQAQARLPAHALVREHKITNPASIRLMKRLGVAHIPTICIDGRPAYESTIPDAQALVRAIEKRYQGKQPQ